MPLILQALRRAASDLTRPRIIGVMFLPMLAALVIWTILLFAFGGLWLGGLEGWLAGLPQPDWLAHVLAAWVLGVLAMVLLGALLLPAIYLTALLITAVAVMPLLLRTVSDTHYAHLQRLQGGTTLGSVFNALYALLMFISLWLLTLPLWLLGPFGAAAGIALNAWLNQRLFMYDALAEHASAEELQALRANAGWPLYGLSALLGLLHLVPLVNLVAPVFMALAFIHYALAALDQQRHGTAA